MRSKDQNYRRERERRLLVRSIRHVSRSGDSMLRALTIEEIRKYPSLIAAWCHETSEMIDESMRLVGEACRR